MESVRESCDSGNRPRLFTFAQILLAMGLCLLLCLCGGCYDGQAMIETTRSNALKSRDVEIDLGKYHTTMPRDQWTNAFTELTVHVFGTAPRHRASSIKKQLRTDNYRLRHHTLTALRGTTRDELAEPDLTQVRDRIERLVNRVLADAPIKQIGFHEIRLQYE